MAALAMSEPCEIEVVDELSVILRIQGRQYTSSEIFGMTDTDLNVVQQTAGQMIHMQAGLRMGRHAARAFTEWADKKPMIFRDKILSYAIVGFTEELKLKR